MTKPVQQRHFVATESTGVSSGKVAFSCPSSQLFYFYVQLRQKHPLLFF